ncbi:MAG: hypothetical protein AAF557_09250 [Pseudomonadota bacterium]
MSETDSFIQEVSEEVRQDQMFALWKKWAPAIIGGITVIVGGAAWWSWSTAEKQADAEARGGQLIAAEPGQVDQFTALPDQIDGPAKLLAELTAAAALAEDGQTDAAVERYVAIADRADIAPEYRDIARLQAVRLGGVSDPAAALDDMIDGNSPYRLLALEQRAAMRLGAGDVDGAHADLNTILGDPMITGALRQRALAVLTATGGEIPGIGG